MVLCASFAITLVRELHERVRRHDEHTIEGRVRVLEAFSSGRICHNLRIDYVRLRKRLARFVRRYSEFLERHFEALTEHAERWLLNVEAHRHCNSQSHSNTDDSVEVHEVRSTFVVDEHVRFEVRPPKSDRAWVIPIHTLDEGFVVGAQVLAESLRLVETRFDVVALVTFDVAKAVGEALVEQDIRVVVTPLVANPYTVLNATGCGGWSEHDYNQNSFTKANSYLLFEYRAFAIVDSDVIFFQNFDSLLEDDDTRPLPRMPVAGNLRNIVQGSIVVDRPSVDKYAALFEHASTYAPTNHNDCTFQGTLTNTYTRRALSLGARERVPLHEMHACWAEHIIDQYQFIDLSGPLNVVSLTTSMSRHNPNPFNVHANDPEKRPRVVHFHTLMKPWMCCSVARQHLDFKTFNVAVRSWWKTFYSLFPEGSPKSLELLESLQPVAECLNMRNP